jgi:polyhydroxyalkanoate synthesis regulator phasin
LALALNSAGNNNTASGAEALYYNSTGGNNTASGYQALLDNTTGNYNNASGYFALRDNTTGSQNSASGVQALSDNKTGNYNTASGTDALYSNTSGSMNIGEGYKAGYNLTTGSNNIDIGNLGVAAESGTIRIGTTSTQSKTYIAGIYGTSVTGSAVVVSSTGQLGVTVSSERFKTDIAPMSSASEKLQQLRPVTFHLKSDPHGPLQYGLIAEEVAKVYPELVIRDESGRIDGVRYDELAPMLVNEAQQQKKQRVAQAIKNAGQDARIAAQDAEIRTLRRQVAELQDLKQELRAALAKPNATDKLVADR